MQPSIRPKRMSRCTLLVANLGHLIGQYLTPAEKWFLITHPFKISTIKKNVDKALAEARKKFSGAGQHNGRGDAFRHCYWSALLARDIGKSGAKDFTTAHEGYSGNPSGEREMDLHNNGIGISIGQMNSKATDAELSDLFEKALTLGRLLTAPPSPGKPYKY